MTDRWVTRVVGDFLVRVERADVHAQWQIFDGVGGGGEYGPLLFARRGGSAGDGARDGADWQACAGAMVRHLGSSGRRRHPERHDATGAGYRFAGAALEPESLPSFKPRRDVCERVNRRLALDLRHRLRGKGCGQVDPA